MTFVVYTLIDGFLNKFEFSSEYDRDCFIRQFEARGKGFIF